VTSGHDVPPAAGASLAGGGLPGGDLDTRAGPGTTITRLDRTSISAAFQRGDDLIVGERNTRQRPGTVSPRQAVLATSTATGGEKRSAGVEQ
jgi:hypothetical protein